MTFDTGAGATAFPLRYKDWFPATAGNGAFYKTASSEFVADQGSVKVEGSTIRNKPCRIRGRLVDVHKPLIAGVEVTGKEQAKNDVYMGHDGGYIMPYYGKIAQAMRKHFDMLTYWYGFEEMTPLYLHNGVFCFDVEMKHDQKDLAPLGEDGGFVAGGVSHPPRQVRP